jgi:signal transduction histidine kinase
MSDPVRILIVDDDASAGRTMDLVLKRRGYETEIATTGREALDKVDRTAFEVVFLDINLPDMSGTELLAPLKKRHPDVVAIILTAYASTESAVSALNEGAYAYITKPFSMDSVLAMVRQGLEKQRLSLENRELLARAQEELVLRLEVEQERERLREQLYQVDRLASLGMLASSVAHDINNPLGTILFNLEHLSEGLPKLARALTDLIAAKGPDEREAIVAAMGHLDKDTVEELIGEVRQALEGARRVREIARDLRFFSRMDEDRRVPVSLNQVVECAANIAMREIQQRARLVKECREVPPILACEGRLTQVIINLLMNAFQSIEEGNPERNVITIRTWADQEEVKVEVMDTGRGIREEELDRIFEPFFSVRPYGSGVGLGLTICQKLVASYGGRIEVDSTVGKGSSFLVSLPIRTESSDARPAVPPFGAETRGAVQGGRVLVVDDEPNFGAAVKKFLAGEFEVVVATSGAEGQLLLEGDRGFDFILCDILMVPMSGIQLYEWVSKLSPELAQRMIFVTGGASMARANEFLSRVPNLTLEKPIDPKNLKVLLRQLMSGRQSLAPSA